MLREEDLLYLLENGKKLSDKLYINRRQYLKSLGGLEICSSCSVDDGGWRLTRGEGCYNEQ
jgi:hypothetical protein